MNPAILPRSPQLQNGFIFNRGNREKSQGAKRLGDDSKIFSGEK
jgi:hypothetical protein